MAEQADGMAQSISHGPSAGILVVEGTVGVPVQPLLPARMDRPKSTVWAGASPGKPSGPWRGQLGIANHTCAVTTTNKMALTVRKDYASQGPDRLSASVGRCLSPPTRVHNGLIPLCWAGAFQGEEWVVPGA